MSETKVCTKCNESKFVDEFGTILKRGKRILSSRCRFCTNEYARERYKNPEVRKAKRAKSSVYLSNPEKVADAKHRSAKFYESVPGRAKTLFASAERRSGKYDSFDITVDWIEEKLRLGVCEITGIQFDFSSHKTYAKNPFAPSIDRKDSTKGYTKENVRIVLWQVNLMRGEMNDEEILGLCKAVVRGLSNESEMDL